MLADLVVDVIAYVERQQGSIGHEMPRRIIVKCVLVELVVVRHGLWNRVGHTIYYAPALWTFQQFLSGARIYMPIITAQDANSCSAFAFASCSSSNIGRCQN